MNILSRQRSAIMGVSIILIMLFHCYIHFDDNVMTFLFRNGNIGVELFALLSAIGINKSLRKDDNIWHFYKKRLLRIFPTYLLVATPYGLFRHFKHGASWGHVISLSTSISTLLGDLTFWFITYILICYLISPLIFRLKQRINIPFLLTIISIPVSIALFLALKNHINNCAVWTLRFPVFFLGFDISVYALNQENKKCRFNSDISKAGLSILTLILVFLILVFSRSNTNSIIKYIIYLFVTLPLGVGIGTLTEICEHYSKPLVLIGSITLELYMLHERICLPIVSEMISNDWIAAIISIIFAIICAKILSALASFFPRIFTRKI